MSLTLDIMRLMAPLARRMRLFVSRGVVKLVDDSLKCQGLQVALLSNELRDGVEHFQEYGFTSRAAPGAEALFVAVGGNRAHGIVPVVTDRRHRPKNMGELDVCLYTDKGERVYLDATGDLVNLGAKSAADFIAQAQLTLDRLTAMVTTYNTHTHPTGTGPSGPPTQQAATPASVATTKVRAS